MVAVVRVLRTSFVAVPALSRVEPASTSGPGAGAMTTSARASRVGGGLQATSTVRAPRRRAVASAARTNGVTPLAETPTTTSPGRTRAAPARWRAARSEFAKASRSHATTIWRDAHRPIRPRGPRPRAARTPPRPPRGAPRPPGLDRLPLRPRGAASLRPQARAAGAPAGAGARALGRGAGPRARRRDPRPGDRPTRVEPLRRATCADPDDARRCRRPRRGSSGCRRALLHLRLDHGADDAGLRAGRRGRRRARSPQSARRRRRRGERARSRLCVLRRALPTPSASWPDHRRARGLPQRAARAGMRPHGGLDEGLAPRDALGEHGPALGAPP